MHSNDDHYSLNGTQQYRAEFSDSNDNPHKSTEHKSAEPYTPDPHRKRKRLARARVEAAEIIDALIDERWQNGENDFSDRAIAERLCDVDETTVGKWRHGDKPMPIAALLCLPLPFGEDLCERLLSARRELAGDTRCIVNLGRAVERCDAYAIHGVMTDENRAAYARALRRFSEQLIDIAESLEAP